jgi:hypothetical protein
MASANGISGNIVENESVKMAAAAAAYSAKMAANGEMSKWRGEISASMAWRKWRNGENER